MDHVHRDTLAHQVNETRVVQGGGEERGGVTTVDGHVDIKGSDLIEIVAVGPERGGGMN